METNKIDFCPNCSKPISLTGFYCGSCLTQVRCKECSNLLELGSAGCTSCGTPRENRQQAATFAAAVNSIRVHETLNERTIEANFTDHVGKDLAGIIRDAYSNRRTDRMLTQGQKHGVDDGLPFTEDTKEDGVVPDADEMNADSGGDSQKVGQGGGAGQKQKPGGTEYPTLKSIAMKALPASETEWVLVYAFYASNFGKETFTRKDILDQYKDPNRETAERKSALSGNLRSLVRAGRINALSDSFSILDEGIELACEIVSRSKSTVLQSKAKAQPTLNEGEKLAVGKKRDGMSGSRSKRLNDLDFHPNGKESLAIYYGRFKTENDNERILLFVSYMQGDMRLSGITYNHIFTCFEELDLHTPLNVPQSTRNAASRTGWIDVVDSKNIVVTTNGKNKIRNWNKSVG
jgi:hypothetical protein